MKIKFIDIQNFRKLKTCRIRFSDKDTLLVGANNSGKTSAMDALINFLDNNKKIDSTEDGKTVKRKFTTTDFTLSNWNTINQFGESWVSGAAIRKEELSEWQKFCPSIDVWLDVELNEVHLVGHLIPTLKWRGGPLGVRLIYQPKKLDDLKEQYIFDYNAAQQVTAQSMEGGSEECSLKLWPRDMRDYLDRRLTSAFEIKAYILDPSQDSFPPQSIGIDHIPLEQDPFKGLFKVDVIEAQRGFFDPNSSQGQSSIGGSLTSQLNQYYNRHLNPTDKPGEDDLAALQAIDSAKESFDERLNSSFGSALDEIRGLGYPGFNDPDIKISSRVNPVETLNHDAAVIFDIRRDDVVDSGLLSLPEKYNGLGYKNLIHIVFKLIAFRDQWMRVGKASKNKFSVASVVEPLHLVLIEEPEAHLHAQVQQVFIRKAYEVLRKDVSEDYSTQMIVSSHSSYIAHEVGFEKLRYFKRKPSTSRDLVPSAEVVDLSCVFASSSDGQSQGEDRTAKFVARYLKTTHCDLFFANGIILVEGAAERILLPHFINSNFNGENSLNSSYISILEVGGAHAQKLRPLVEALDIPTLVISDTDALNTEGKKARPLRGKNYLSGSDTIKSWFGHSGKELDEILDLEEADKVRGTVRVAFQTGIQVQYVEGGESTEAIPYTFEDAIAYTNLDLFKSLPNPTGMMSKMKSAFLESTLEECGDKLFESLEGDKAKMALDLLFDVPPEELAIPEYIKEGLEWLDSELGNASQDFIIDSVTADEGSDNVD